MEYINLGKKKNYYQYIPNMVYKAKRSEIGKIISKYTKLGKTIDRNTTKHEQNVMSTVCICIEKNYKTFPFLQQLCGGRGNY